MARVVAIFGSCLSTNAKIFGFEQSDSKEGSIPSLMGRLGSVDKGLEASEGPRLICDNIATDLGGYDITENISFPDPQVPFPIKVEMLAGKPGFYVVRKGSFLNPAGKTKSSETDLKLLIPIERIAYKQAIIVGDKSTIDRLNKKILNIKGSKNGPSPEVTSA